MTALTGVANGLYDLRTALARARFFDRAYIEIVLIKNGFGLVLTVGGALAFGSAKIALAGACLSVGVAMAATYRDLRDPEARLDLAERPLARTYFGYAGPFVVSSVLFQLIPFVGRVLAGTLYGYDEAGQFSLANDIGVRVLAAIASALDVILFQQAVRAEETFGSRGRAGATGRQHGVRRRRRPARRRGALAVPAGHRGADRAQGLSRTVLGLSRADAAGARGVRIDDVRRRADFSDRQAHRADDPRRARGARRRRRALGESAARPSGILARRRAERRSCRRPRASPLSWPGRRARNGRARAIFSARSTATGAMALALWPTRGLEPSLALLAAQASIGVAIYGALAWIFDVARLRERVKAMFGPGRRRGRRRVDQEFLTRFARSIFLKHSSLLSDNHRPRLAMRGAVFAYT